MAVTVAGDRLFMGSSMRGKDTPWRPVLFDQDQSSARIHPSGLIHVKAVHAAGNTIGESRVSAPVQPYKWKVNMPAKRLVFGDEAHARLIAGMNKLADAVRVTL